MGPAPEASFPVNRATGPGSPMGTAPFSARGALLAIAASEPSSYGGEKPDLSTVPKCATARALKVKELWLQLPVVPPFPP